MITEKLCYGLKRTAIHSIMLSALLVTSGCGLIKEREITKIKEVSSVYVQTIIDEQNKLVGNGINKITVEILSVDVSVSGNTANAIVLMKTSSPMLDQLRSNEMMKAMVPGKEEINLTLRKYEDKGWIVESAVNPTAEKLNALLR